MPEYDDGVEPINPTELNSHEDSDPEEDEDDGADDQEQSR